MRLGVSLVVLSCMLIGSAAADDQPGKQKKADELFEQGRKMLAEAQDDKEKVALACEKFNEAIKLDPEAPGTMLNLGLCNEKLSKYKTALYWFRKAQARAAETGLPEYEKAAKDHTVDLATNKVATIKIVFSSPPPPDAKVKIDGEEVKSDDFLNTEVDPGTHTLVAGAAGKKIFTKEFEVVGRGGDTYTIDFVEGDNSIVVDKGAGRRKAALFIAIGGGVLWGVAGGVSLYAKGKYCDNFNAGGCGEPLEINKDKPDAISEANRYRNMARYGGTTVFIVGAVAIGGAIALYLTAPEKERIDRTVMVPMIGNDHLGVGFSGGF